MLCYLGRLFDEMGVGADGFDLFRHFLDHSDELGGLCRRDP